LGREAAPTRVAAIVDPAARDGEREGDAAGRGALDASVGGLDEKALRVQAVRCAFRRRLGATAAPGEREQCGE
jgi:hypothetical protein